jgi:uncharacterized protein (TIGR00730 family)
LNFDFIESILNYKRITVFCGATKNADKLYLDEAEKLGKLLAHSGRAIIYGGGKIGLMGSLADGALSVGGKITGIIPGFLNDMELAHNGISELRQVVSLHARESQMLIQTDCIIALPGGIGTFSELLQAITWKRLWQIEAKIIIVNINKYFNPLIAMLNKSIRENFLRNEFANLWTVVNNVEEVMFELEKEKEVVSRQNNLV